MLEGKFEPLRMQVLVVDDELTHDSAEVVVARQPPTKPTVTFSSQPPCGRVSRWSTIPKLAAHHPVVACPDAIA